MADDAAHIPAGPRGDSTDAVMADVVADDDESDVSEEPVASSPSTDDHTGTTVDDVELIGWQLAPSATSRQRELVAVGSREAASPSFPGFGDTTAEPSPWRGQPLDMIEDAPTWSFPGLAADQPAPDAPSPAAADGNQSELPLAAPVAPSLPPPRPRPMFGPVGRTRSALLVPVLSAVTLGVYALVWHHDINREMEEFDPKLHSRPRRSTVAVLVPWLAGLLITMAGAALIITSRFGVHLPFNPHVSTAQAYYLLAGLAAVPYLALLLPFSAVAVVMTLERLRSVEEHVGATTDRQVRPVGTSLLLAIPVVGGLVLLALEQRRLNAVWQAVTPSGPISS
jgi:hypothetical protein